MGKEIRIIKKDDQRKFEDSTLVDNDSKIELRKTSDRDDDNTSSSSSSSYKKKHKEKNLFKLRNNPRKNMKSHNKSRLVGGHGSQSHSPVYE